MPVLAITMNQSALMSRIHLQETWLNLLPTFFKVVIFLCKSKAAEHLCQFAVK